MAAAGQYNAFRIEDARASCRQICATYFYQQPTHAIRIGKLSEELLETLTKLRDLPAARVSAPTKEEAFSILTHNFERILKDFGSRLHVAFGAAGRSTEVQIHSAATDPDLLDSQHQLQYLQYTLNVMIEGLQRCESRRRPRDRTVTYALNEDDATVKEELSDLLGYIFEGCTDHDMLGKELPAESKNHDTSSGSRRDLAQSVQRSIMDGILRALGQTTSESAQCHWKLRHSIYWLHCSLESLRSAKQSGLTRTGRRSSREISQINHRIAATFVHAIKSACLLNEISNTQYNNINVLLQQISLLLRKKVLEHLHSYSSYFVIPDYDAISEQDFRMGMVTRHNSITYHQMDQILRLPESQSRTRTRTLNPENTGTVTETYAPHLAISNSDISYTSDAQIAESPVGHSYPITPFNSSNDGLTSQRRPQQQFNIHRNEVAGSYNNSRDHVPESSSHARLNATHPPLIPQRRHGASILHEHTRRESGADGVSGDSSSEPSAPPEVPADRQSTSSTRPRTSVESRESRNRAGASMPCSPLSLVGAVDGLHVTDLERYLPVQHIDDVVPFQGEFEIENPEVKEPRKGGFFFLKSRTVAGDWYPSRVRIFRSKSSNTLRVCTGQGELPPQTFDLNLRDDELVPLYAWADSAEDGAELYLRHNGQQHGFYYKFFSVEGLSELHGFQSVLTSSSFELQLRVHLVSFAHSRHPIDMRNPKSQIWTLDDVPVTGQPSPGPQPGIRRAETIQWPPENLSTTVDELNPQRSCSKILFFHSKRITVLLISERVHIEYLTNPKHSLRRGSIKPKAARILPTRSRGCTHVRAITLLPDIGDCAGLPLDHNGIQYTDQDNDKFEDFTHVDIEFHTPENCTEFVTEFRRLRAIWETKFADLTQFRELQRRQTISTITRTILG